MLIASTLHFFCLYTKAHFVSVDGMWGPWGGWSGCDQECGGGIESNERFCDSPYPQHEGSPCIGGDGTPDLDDYEQTSRGCNSHPCPSKKHVITRENCKKVLHAHIK